MEVPIEHVTEIKVGNLNYLFPICSCGWEGGCWASYQNARSEIYNHEVFVKEMLRLYNK